ncbi:MAG TPA: 4a-hydroxytetrahydrobiopterin dehydratase [Ilumatobacter sp.]|nr:4a-hydroxytetrahydrobiopterin dehydratase [Ilumatobacter sp.]
MSDSSRDATLGQSDIDAAGIADWRMFGPVLLTRFRTGNFADGLRLLNAIGEAAEQANHHPDLDLRYPHLNVKLYSHDAGGVTERDVALARRISGIAAEHGVSAAPSDVETVELALDTPDFKAIKPFWRAVLGYKDNPHLDDEVRNDDGALPPLWFQASGSDEPRQRFHIDVRVPKEIAEQRIAAAVAAGGKVVDEASTFTVLQDSEGNKACVCS